MRRLLGTRLLASALLLVLTGALEGGVPAVADGTTSTAAVTVDSPAWGATVSGTVDVHFTVTADPAAAPTSAVVSLRRLDDGYSSPLTQTVDIPAGTCTESCSLEASLDTLAWSRPVPGGTDLNQYDRLDLPITVVLSDSLGGVTKSSVVNLDNDRPEFQCPGFCEGDTIEGSSARDTVTGVYRFREWPRFPQHLRVWVAGRAESTEQIVDVAPGVNTVTRVVQDVSGLPEGNYILMAVGFTSDGAASAPRWSHFSVKHGSRFTIEWPEASHAPGPSGKPLLPSDTSMFAPMTLHVAAPTAPGAATARVDVYVDGRMVDSSFVPTHTDAFDVTIPWRAMSLGEGVHHGVVRVADTRNAAWEVDLPDFETESGPAATVAVAGTMVHRVSRPTITGEIAARTGAALRSWRVVVDGTAVALSGACDPASGLCPSRIPLSIAWPAEDAVNRPGQHTVRVEGVDRLGMSVSTTATATSIASTTASIRRSATRVRRGARVTVSGVVKSSTGALLAGAHVDVLARPVGASRWVTVAGLSTSSTGTVRRTVTLRRSTDFRLVVPAVAQKWAGTKTGTVRTVVR